MSTPVVSMSDVAEIRWAGDRALLVCPTGHDGLLEVVDRLRDAALPGVEDILPAAETVLLTLRDRSEQGMVESEVRKALTGTAAERATTAEGTEEVVIPVRYDGEDLADVARMTDDERHALLGVPSDPNSLARCFTLSRADQDLVASRRGDANRLGFAVQLALLRHPGTILANLDERPEPLVAWLAAQLDIPASAFAAYARRPQTMTDHARRPQATCR